MAKMINCDCGFVAHGSTDDEVVEAVRSHMTSDHPHVCTSVDPRDIYGWIQEV